MNNNQPRYQLIEPRGVHGEGSSLGEGAYGVVYKALDRLTNRSVALKKIRLETEFDGISSSTVREITLLMQLNHENVVKLENVVMDKDRMSLIFELVDLDLKKYLDMDKNMLPLDKVKSFSKQLLSGLAYCHSMGVMHRDLKPHNILISLNGSLKIADFGLARAFTPFNRALTMEVITRWYRAPEILLGCMKYSCSVDMWSVGCIIAEMYNKRPLLTGDSDVDQLYRIFRLMGTPNNDYWKEVESLPYYRNNFPQWPPLQLGCFLVDFPANGIGFLEKMFDYNPKRRISAKAALLHPFITGENEVSNTSAYIVSPGSNIGFRTPHINHNNDTNKTVQDVTPELVGDELVDRGVADSSSMSKNSDIVIENITMDPSKVSTTKEEVPSLRYKLLEFIGDEVVIDKTETEESVSQSITSQKRKRTTIEVKPQDSGVVENAKTVEEGRRVSARLRMKK